MKNLGQMKKILGIKVDINRLAGAISLSQAAYINILLHRFNFVPRYTRHKGHQVPSSTFKRRGCT